MKTKTAYLCRGAAVAAVYVLMTFVSSLFGLASGPVQIRISEALCILPVLMPESVPGLSVGCLAANILTGALLPDTVFGTLATLLGAVGTRLFRKNKILAFLSPVVSNTVIIPFILRLAYGINKGFLLLAAGVFVGEAISVLLLGGILYRTLSRKTELFR